jgi:hypothetical protein
MGRDVDPLIFWVPIPRILYRVDKKDMGCEEELKYGYVNPINYLD